MIRETACLHKESCQNGENGLYEEKGTFWMELWRNLMWDERWKFDDIVFLGFKHSR